MEKTFFDENVLKNFKTVLCPNCKKEIEVDSEDIEIICDECGCSIEQAPSEDFVWHPSERY
jgi:predicted amidophosphoribosyltransferase